MYFVYRRSSYRTVLVCGPLIWGYNSYIRPTIKRLLTKNDYEPNLIVVLKFTIFVKMFALNDYIYTYITKTTVALFLLGTAHVDCTLCQTFCRAKRILFSHITKKRKSVNLYHTYIVQKSSTNVSRFSPRLNRGQRLY